MNERVHSKYWKVVITKQVNGKLEDIALRYEIEFLEIGTDSDYVHFLVQSVLSHSPTQIVRMIKNITAKEIFKHLPEAKKQFRDGYFWSSGYYIRLLTHTEMKKH